MIRWKGMVPSKDRHVLGCAHSTGGAFDNDADVTVDHSCPLLNGRWDSREGEITSGESVTHVLSSGFLLG